MRFGATARYLLLALGIASCAPPVSQSSTDASRSPSPSPSATPVKSTKTSSPIVTSSPRIVTPSQAFLVDGLEAAAITTVMRFIQAINSGDSSSAEMLVTLDGYVSDCDFVKNSVLEFQGRRQVAAWIATQIAGHARFVVGTMANDNTTFNRAVGVDFTSRYSDALKAIGLPAGMPWTGTKVGVSPDASQISVFALGPAGADPITVAQICSRPF